jgi:hypothetical protein
MVSVLPRVREVMGSSADWGFKFGLNRISFLSGFSLDRFHCVCNYPAIV